MRLDEELLARVDAARVATPRERWIREALVAYLTPRPPEPVVVAYRAPVVRRFNPQPKGSRK